MNIYNHRVTLTNQLADVYFYTLELLNEPNQSSEQILNLLSKFERIPLLKLLLNQFIKDSIYLMKLLQAEQIAQDYPYHCIIQKVNKDNSSLSQRIVNKQFYTLMGVTRDMVSHHFHKTKTLPSIFDIGTSLKLFCDISFSSLLGVSYFDQYINTYEGAQYKCNFNKNKCLKELKLFLIKLSSLNLQFSSEMNHQNHNYLILKDFIKIKQTTSIKRIQKKNINNFKNP